MQTVTADGGVGQERRHLTVMFCDVVGSTGLSGRQDIEAYFSILQAYYDACRPVVERYHGLVAQHQGDGIFVWFGYPEPHDDDAIRAVRAGLDMLAVLRRLSSNLESVVGEPLSVRMAAHAGEVLIAPVDGQKTPVAFGHTPNVAAKLQQSARPGCMVITDTVRQLTADAFDLEPLEPLRLADGSVLAAFEVVGEHRAGGRVQRRWRTPLVDRKSELQRLAEAWSRTEGGASAAVLLSGERGIGKTRLASAIAAAAEAANGNVLDCACHPLDAGSAYRPYRALLTQAAGIEPGDPPIVAAALLGEHLIDELGMDEQTAAILGGVIGLPAEVAGRPAELDPARLAQITAEILVDWLTRLAREAPTLLLIDDVPDADPSTLGVIAQIVAAGAPAQLMVVLTARSDRALPAFLATPSVEVVELTPLTESAALELVAAVESPTPLDEPERRQVATLGEGVPLYLEELARAAQEANNVGLLPVTLTGGLQVRLSAPGVDREIIGVLAAAGQDLEETMLAAVLEVSLDDVQQRMTALLDADLVVRAGATATSVQIRHGLIAEAAYTMLLHGQRARLHARLADVLQAQSGDGRTVDWSIVGQHLRRANKPLDAYEAILAGAEQARSTGAINEALGAYNGALELVATIADSGVHDVLELRCRLQRGIAAVSARGFGADEAVEDFGRCAELCRMMGPRPEHLTALSGVYAFYLLQGELLPRGRSWRICVRGSRPGTSTIGPRTTSASGYSASTKETTEMRWTN